MPKPIIRLFGCRSSGSLCLAWPCPSRGSRLLTAVVAVLTALAGPADVYLDEDAFVEQRTLEEMRQRPQSWSCAVQDNATTIWANFGTADPNQHLTEINVRECLFMPELSGLSYITIDGFHFLHAAANWAPPVIPLQTGAVDPRLGKRWIIQNCTIINARCVGIILGQAPGVDYNDIDTYGDHIVRNNVIWRCGQAGIARQKGATRSLITANLIEEYSDEPRNRWWVLGQWHDQPDPAKGETWTGFPGRSRPVYQVVSKRRWQSRCLSGRFQRTRAHGHGTEHA